MVYHLHIGNKRYSSWSMRPWVLLKALDIPFKEHLHLFKPGSNQPDFFSFSPVGRVPCLSDDNTSESIRIWDSLAICEYIAEKYPKVWPKDPAARSFARCAVAEMHSSFNALRNECSMIVALRIDLGDTLSEALQRDLERLSGLFNEGLAKFGGPWLVGEGFTAADAFFAPVASRCKTYGLKLDGAAARYIERLFEHSAVQEWIRDGIEETAREPKHEEISVAGRTVLQDLSE
ncbi:uncharacterized protein RCC_10493 [Ramularia collo-cygni]|uniref:GST N-terminal domain-containing protein n=1 Tax=Ramularia collo-cygni TaxID=112498 RepID=A0A2D3VFR8_9PEZI|nr:uncharacterized protein RCC_10493 [Ramularia collo-cygni]CZT24765.1 uncharacterized protein RCC_10493 [Ramularia collo-cygni]